MFKVVSYIIEHAFCYILIIYREMIHVVTALADRSSISILIFAKTFVNLLYENLVPRNHRCIDRTIIGLAKLLKHLVSLGVGDRSRDDVFAFPLIAVHIMCTSRHAVAV